MMALANVPFVTIRVAHPPGLPDTWTDEALISYIDEYDAKLAGLDEHAVIDDSFIVWSHAWIVLEARTDPGSIFNHPWICAHCQVEFPNYRAKEAHRATLAWVHGA